jgi:hypothetical protein
MCRVLAVSASGFCAWRRRLSELTPRIRVIHQYSRGTHGAPRIHQELVVADIHAACKRVARLMRGAGQAGASRSQWMVTTVRAHDASQAA